jgi:penicillin-binding protein 1B
MARAPARPQKKKKSNKRSPSRSSGGKRSSGSRKSKRKPNRRPLRRRWLARLLALGLLFSLIAGLYLFYLDYRVTSLFEGKRWAVPARVYGRPMELYPGAPVTPEQLVAELDRLGYRKVRHPKQVATWSRNRSRFLVRSRPFRFWDTREPGHYLDLRFKGGQLNSVKNISGRDLPLVRLEAPEIGSIYPAESEDRVLVSRQDLPDLLVQALLSVEDRAFFSHHGIDLKAVLRAVWVNLRAGGVVQGGSTLTQQLVKNLYLTRERSLWRKLTEAAMALMLDAHYPKDEILTAYTNEIYLGQDGGRAIHGFGLASRFYFNRPLQELGLPRLALLVGIVRGPSYYNPRRHPKRARKRRDLVLTLMEQQGVITPAQRKSAAAAGLGVTRRGAIGSSNHPAFIELVRRQLRRDYREEDLTSEGLRIFTTLDPWVQQQAESALARRLKKLEKGHRLPAGKLEGAAVVADSVSGGLLALVGGRHAGYAGFNRALDAVRPIGSLIKPVVYLAALMEPEHYTLITRLKDQRIHIRGPDGKVWAPRNYDRKPHGRVPLHQALARSYNLATVQLGMDLGLERILELTRSLGVQRSIEPVPSLLLGAVALSPLEVAQLYQSFASGGFYSPLRAIQAVQAADGRPLQRYPLTVHQAVPSGPVYLLNHILQEVVRSGTGRGLSAFLPSKLELAGKTGTTDDLRDSWFAGFSGDRVGVVWVGRDDNKPAGLTGSQGALKVWGEMMERLRPVPLKLVRPDTVGEVWIDTATGLRADKGCKGARRYPFIRGSAPAKSSPCAAAAKENILDRIRRFFE